MATSLPLHIHDLTYMLYVDVWYPYLILILFQWQKCNFVRWRSVQNCDTAALSVIFYTKHFPQNKTTLILVCLGEFAVELSVVYFLVIGIRVFHIITNVQNTAKYLYKLRQQHHRQLQQQLQKQNNMELENTPISQNEVEKAVRILKQNKSPGVDDIILELPEHRGQHFSKTLMLMIAIPKKGSLRLSELQSNYHSQPPH